MAGAVVVAGVGVSDVLVVSLAVVFATGEAVSFGLVAAGGVRSAELIAGVAGTGIEELYLEGPALPVLDATGVEVVDPDLLDPE